tara:strand:+ start:207 stop:704 length:498 start_codon:yes stop_codon:yes gene_type:complete
MSKKYIIIFSIFIVLLSYKNVYANSQGYRDELPALQRLTDLSIGIKRINKGLKFESKGKIKKADKMYNEAIDFLLKANKNRDIDANIFFYLGFTYNKLENFDNAETYYILGLTIDPSHSHINNHLGQLYLKQKKLNLAKKNLEILKNCNCEEYLDLKKSFSNYKY